MKITDKHEIKPEKSMARIFEDVGGYYVCSDDSDCLDARGNGYDTKAAALRAAYAAGYTHAIGSGAYKQGARIIWQVSVTDWDHEDHSRAAAERNW